MWSYLLASLTIIMEVMTFTLTIVIPIILFKYIFFNKKQPIVVSIEGNIGVGKSTLIDLLKQKLNSSCEFVSEPTDEWSKIVDENGRNLLDLYYTDMKRWAYTFQNMAYITRMHMIVEKNKKYK